MARRARGLSAAEKARLAAMPRPEGPPGPQRASVAVSEARVAVCRACKLRKGELETGTAYHANTVGYARHYEADFVITKTTFCKKLGAVLHSIINMHNPHCPAGKWKA